MDIVADNIDTVSEKYLISSLMSDEGYKIWVNISDIVQPSSFIADNHSNSFAVIDSAFRTHGEVKIDWPTFIGSAKSLGLDGFFNKKDEKDYLKEVKKLKSDITSAKPLAVKLRKLEIARSIREQLKSCDGLLSKISGDEKFTDILNIVEKPIFDFAQLIRSSDKTGPKLIFSDIDKYLDYLEANPVQQIGIKSGFDIWDKCIGGGLINGSVSVIAARVKTGKSILADTIAYNVCKQGIPVLMLDTEMVIEQHYNRLLGTISGVNTDEIKTGQYSLNQLNKNKVREAGKILKDLPYHYINISGQEFDETLGDMRRWIMSKVGLDGSGRAKPCVIILDYLKMMSAASMSKNMAEYIALGFQMISFVNFMIKYHIPGVTFLQLNRDGINSEETSAIAGSDRLNWFCSNLSYFKAQSEEEVNEQIAKGAKVVYSRKLIPIFAREGPGLDEGDYINMDFRRHITRVTEGPTRFDLAKESYGKNEPIVTKEDPQIQY